jgi:hypothetical protein
METGEIRALAAVQNNTLLPKDVYAKDRGTRFFTQSPKSSKDYDNGIVSATVFSHDR